MRVLLRQSVNDKTYRVVVEYPPQRRLLRACGRTYRVAAPHTIFSVRMQDTLAGYYSNNAPQILWRPAPTKTVRDEVYATWFTNVSLLGYVCLPGSPPAPTPDACAANVVKNFWESEFNFDRVEQAHQPFLQNISRDLHSEEQARRYYRAWQEWGDPLPATPLGPLEDFLYSSTDCATEFIGVEKP